MWLQLRDFSAEQLGRFRKYQRQVYATFINEPIFIKTLDIYGPGNAMWSSDYPHTAATWPRSQDFINNTFNNLSDSDRRQIVHDTAAKVYRIEV